jgi:nitrogen fixation NifU-like protein
MTSLATYSDVIRERWRHPKFRGQLPGANAVAEDVNPLCGDRVRLMLSIGGGRVAEARFAGDSCAICAASADVTAELVTGRSVAEARRLEATDLLAVLQADIRPTRMRCVTLPLSVLALALGSASRDGASGEASGEMGRKTSASRDGASGEASGEMGRKTRASRDGASGEASGEMARKTRASRDA